MKTLILTQRDVKNIVHMRMALDAVDEAYRTFAKSQLKQPPIVTLEAEEHNGETDIKACYSRDNETISIKTAAGYWDNRKHCLPTLMASITLLDGKTGYPLCIMDGSLITGYRTGAAGGLSAMLLARNNSKSVAVIGSGTQARMQLTAIKEVLDVQEAWINAPSFDQMSSFKAEMEEKLSLQVTPTSTAEEAVRQADIIVTATPSKKPLIMDAWVKKGTHIIAVGADGPGKQELDTALFRRAKIYVDSKAQCIALGEIRNAIEAGTLAPDSIHAELGDVLIGTREGRTSDDEITLFDTTGMGIQDNTLAHLIYQVALKKGMGLAVDFLNG